MKHKTFREAFVARMNKKEINFVELAERTGIKKDTLHSIKRRSGGSTSIERAITIARLGFNETLSQFMGWDAVELDPSITQSLSELPESERQVLLDMIKSHIEKIDQTPE